MKTPKITQVSVGFSDRLENIDYDQQQWFNYIGLGSNHLVFSDMIHRLYVWRPHDAMNGVTLVTEGGDVELPAWEGGQPGFTAHTRRIVYALIKGMVHNVGGRTKMYGHQLWVLNKDSRLVYSIEVSYGRC